MIFGSGWWLGGMLGCVDGTLDDARQAWLVDALIDDNRIWLSRDRTLLEVKYREMAEDPYDFMRGTTAVSYRDLERRGSDRAPTAFLVRADATAILMVGDPHPENVGSLLPGDGPGPTEGQPPLVLEFNDFDAAGFGPYLLDLRRALLGLGILLDRSDCGKKCREEVLTAEIEGYFDEISAIDSGTPRFDPRLIQGEDPVLDLLLDEVVGPGLERALLEEVTRVDDRGRRFLLDRTLDDDGDGILAVSPSERAQARRLLSRYPSSPAGFRIQDIARRYGVGIASLPAIRYVVAWDRGEEGPQDDELLQLREVVDPPALPSVPRWTPTLFDGNDHRSVTAARTLWSCPDADIRLDSVEDGPMTFKAQSWSSFEASQDHGRIEEAILEGLLDEEALIGWASRLGAQLAAAHGRSVTADREPAIEAIAADLGGRRVRFVRERLDEAERDLELLKEDHRRFRDALDELGPLLGADGFGP